MAYLDNNGVTYLWNKIKGLFNKGITNLSVSGKTITFTKGDGTTGTITTQDTNTTYGNFKGATASADGGSGLVPAPTKGNEGKYLKADGTGWKPIEVFNGHFDGKKHVIKGFWISLSSVNNIEKAKSHEDDILNAINNREKEKSHKSEPMNR